MSRKISITDGAVVLFFSVRNRTVFGGCWRLKILLVEAGFSNGGEWKTSIADV
jgi:hypothetical protein